MAGWPTTLGGLRDVLRALDLPRIQADLRGWAQTIRNGGPVGTSTTAPDIGALRAAGPPSYTALEAVARRHGVQITTTGADDGRGAFQQLRRLWLDELNVNLDPEARRRYRQLEQLAQVERMVAQIPGMLANLEEPVPNPAAPGLAYAPGESGVHGKAVNLATNQALPDELGLNYFGLGGGTHSWWPRAAADLEADGIFSSEVPLTLLTVPMDLPSYLEARAAVNQEAANWRGHYLALRTSRTRTSRARLPFRRGMDSLRHWVVSLDRFAASQIASWFETIDLAYQSISGAETPVKGAVTMPPAIATSSVVASLAADIAARISTGQGGRLQVGGAEQAFSWGVGLPTTLLTYVPAAQVAGRHVDTVLIKSTTAAGATIAHVAEGGTKPSVAAMTTAPVDLLKYAAIASLSTESANFVSSIEQALVQVMGSDLVRAIEAALAAELTAAAGVTIAGGGALADDVIAAIATVAGNGGQAGVVALAPADWVTLMSQQGTGGYLNFTSPEAGPGTFFGLAPVIVPGLVDPLVFDPRGAITYEVAGGPLCIVDMASALSTNGIRVAIETWAAPKVTSPGVVVRITPDTPRKASAR